MKSVSTTKTKTVSLKRSKAIPDVLEQLRRSLADMEAGRIRNAEY